MENEHHNFQFSIFNYTLFFDGLSLIAGVHIIIALDLAVVELALLVAALAEVVLELGLGGDDILLPAVGEFEVAAKGLIQPLGLPGPRTASPPPPPPGFQRECRRRARRRSSSRCLLFAGQLP